MHIEPTAEQAAAFFGNPPEGPVVMLNLLRFREVADYSKSPKLAPDSPISGAEAYQRYAAAVAPLLVQAGSELVFSGDAAGYLIGPAANRWDLVLLVRYTSAQAMFAFVSSADYQAIGGHRTAALEDSRLLPIQQADFG